jgi:hypothetical protein
LIYAGELEACPFFFLNFKGTPSQEELETIFSGLRIDDMALSDQIDYSAFFHLRNMTYRNFINFGIGQPIVALALYSAMF